MKNSIITVFESDDSDDSMSIPDIILEDVSK
jgi:hypothetical protein